MKYFADYFKEEIFAINEKSGDGVIICEYGTFPIHKDPENIPWLSEENGIGFLVEEMTKEEFDTYGKTWQWGGFNPKPGRPNSWRDYKEDISD